MNELSGAMGDAFERLARQQACPGHVWGEPKTETYTYGRQQETLWATRCKRCDRRASRPTLDQLQTEVIDSGPTTKHPYVEVTAGREPLAKSGDWVYRYRIYPMSSSEHGITWSDKLPVFDAQQLLESYGLNEAQIWELFDSAESVGRGIYQRPNETSIKEEDS